MKKATFFIFSFIIFLAILSYSYYSRNFQTQQTNKLKIYWFIPDGLRSEPEVFKIYEWAKSGELPNLKYLIENGSSGYSRPVFPSHTPVNFATLMTGTWPEKHGVADGPMRLQGYPLNMILKGGFSSAAKNVTPIWTTLEKEKNMVSLLSVPGSTPPELYKGLTIKGRWGNWGIEFPSVIFNSPSKLIDEEYFDQDKRVLSFSHQLTMTRPIEKNKLDWSENILKKYSKVQEINLSLWGQNLFGLLVVSPNSTDFNKIIFSFDKKTIAAELKAGEWSPWLNCKLNWQTKNDYNTQTPKKSDWESSLSQLMIESQIKINVIKIDKSPFYRIRVVYDSLNDFNVQPSEASQDIHKKIGPMIDFVDNFPPQLIFFDEDKKTFLDEMTMSFDWHQKMVSYLIKDAKSDVVIHSVYNPNQMLTSRWWLPYLDPKSPRYNDVTEEQRKKLWAEVKNMYVQIDLILGEIIKNSDPSTYIFFSSDHGVIPLWKEVRLNNLFAQNGWLKTKYSKEKNETEIDWGNSRVVFTQMNTIYINPKNLGGPYRRADGDEYQKLRQDVIVLLRNLKDPETNTPVLENVWTWEQADQIRLPKDRIGDLVVSNAAHYIWSETLTQKKEVFKVSLKGGYKQAALNTLPELLTPFVAFGPGIKKNYQISHIIDHADQYTTLLSLLKYKIPNFVQGKKIEEIFISK